MQRQDFFFGFWNAHQQSPDKMHITNRGCIKSFCHSILRVLNALIHFTIFINFICLSHLLFTTLAK